VEAFTAFVILLLLYFLLAWIIQKHSPAICTWDNSRCDQKCRVIAFIREQIKDRRKAAAIIAKCPFREKEAQNDTYLPG